MATPPVKSFNLNIGPIHAHAFNADRTQVALTTGKEFVFIYALEGGKWVEKHILAEHDMAVTSLDWAPKTNRIVTCSRDKNAYVWTFENGKWVACLVLARLSFAATCVKWSPLENKFAVGSSQKIVSVCHYEKENNWWVAKHIKVPICSTVSCIDWHPENVLLAVGSYDFKARVFSAYVKEVDEKPAPNPWGSKMPFGQLMVEFKSSGWVKAIGFSPSGCRLCWISQDAMIYVVSADQDITKVLSYRGNEMPLKSLCWTSENTFLTAGHSCMPYAYSVNSNQITRTAELDVPTDKNAGAALNARAMFQNMDRLATQRNTDTQMNTLHQNCITQVLPFQGKANQGVTSFSTVGFDSQLVIWPIRGRN